nr:hypothetical protein [Eubacterium sp.]
MDHDSRGVVSLTGNKEDEVAYMQVNGMLSSLYENLIWEEMTGAKSVSTMAVLENSYRFVDEGEIWHVVR